MSKVNNEIIRTVKITTTIILTVQVSRSLWLVWIVKCHGDNSTDGRPSSSAAKVGIILRPVHVVCHLHYLNLIRGLPTCYIWLARHHVWIVTPIQNNPEFVSIWSNAEWKCLLNCAPWKFLNRTLWFYWPSISFNFPKVSMPSSEFHFLVF